MAAKSKVVRRIDPAKVSEGVLRLNPWLRGASGPIAIEIPDAEPVAAPGIVQTEKPKRAKVKKMSAAEMEFEAHLKRRVAMGEIREYRFEAMRLVVGEHTCTYTPDFAVFELDDSITLIEIKGGRTWEDALVKYKAACLIWKCFKWEFWDKTKEGWKRIY